MIDETRSLIGAGIRRKEDPRLLTGAGRFVDDVVLPDLLHLAVLRSPHAHARLRHVDLAPARAWPGVVAAVDGAAVRDRLGPLPTAVWRRVDPALEAAVDVLIRMETQHLIAVDTARYAGQAVAVVLADSRYTAEDAAERIVVDYEPLPPVLDAQAASRPDAARLHPDLPDNLAARVRLATGDVDGAFATADHVVRRRFRMQRLTGIPIETRGVVARPEPGGGVTVWAATQSPHLVRDAIVHHLGLDAARVRVLAQDVGGGYGIKVGVYPELVVAAWLAVTHGRPVKWIEDRYEHLRCAPASRDQEHAIELALRADGTILGLRDHFTIDVGAYNPAGLVQPYNSAAHLLGPYRVPAAAITGEVYYTNKAPLGPYRGAGRPEAVLAMDRALDVAARELGLDPAELRRRNLITPAEIPYDVGLVYRDARPLVYDSGDYPATLDQALQLVGYDAVRREQPALWARGVYRGVGLSAYVEGTGIGPFEGASVGVDAAGHVWVYSGACSQGQGHETAFAQLCAAQLGLTVDQVTVVPGDTAGVARGRGTNASRSTVAAGMAIVEAAQTVREQLRALAAELLEASPADLELHAGTVRVVGVPERAASFAQLVARVEGPNPPGPPSLPRKGGAAPAPSAPRSRIGRGAGGVGPTALPLRVERYYEPPTVTYANAVHAALVEVDAATGAVRLLRYAVVHDCGRVVNPVLVDGQIHGGVAQGIGNALMEELVYDESGQLLSGSLADYLVPTACDVPPMPLGHQESLSPRNPLGLKGLGEGGAISPPAAIANAVEDALRPLDVEITATPLTPERVLALIEAARACRAGG
ncbi:MAG TPA: xanthine dehydrogenase family protein molybdopterin-binding subunit [Chloroflexota bacterium]|nr:xanthine dehydrogenase family protein molybdopterin-binding subunit [Chloroflexota bacterium]